MPRISSSSLGTKSFDFTRIPSRITPFNLRPPGWFLWGETAFHPPPSTSTTSTSSPPNTRVSPSETGKLLRLGESLLPYYFFNLALKASLLGFRYNGAPQMNLRVPHPLRLCKGGALAIGHNPSPFFSVRFSRLERYDSPRSSQASQPGPCFLLGVRC